MDNFRKWFEDYLDHWHGFIKKEVEDDGGFDAYLMIVRKGGADIVVMPAPMGSPSRRSAVMRLQRVIAKEEDLVDGVVLVTTAWSLAVEGGEAVAKTMMQEGSLADHPDKTEIALWSAMRGSQQLLAVADITGPDDKRSLGSFTIIDPAEGIVEGRITGNT